MPGAFQSALLPLWIRKATLLMTKQNHKNKQLGVPAKALGCHALFIFWFGVSCFFDPRLMGMLDVGPTAGQRGNFVQAHCVGLRRTVTKPVGGRSVHRCMLFLLVLLLLRLLPHVPAGRKCAGRCLKSALQSTLNWTNKQTQTRTAGKVQYMIEWCLNA